MFRTLQWANLWITAVSLLLFCNCAQEEPDSLQVDSFSKNDALHTPTFRILILGDSLTEGYGIAPSEAYPFLLEKKLNTEFVGKNLRYEVINGGVTGSTTSGGASRINWYLQSPPNFLIIALGGNDGLRGISPEDSKENLKRIILKALDKKVSVLLAGMKIPPNYGIQYFENFQNIFPQLADELNVPLLPFLLEGVGGKPHMNLPDRIHPNPEGHRKICENVYRYLIQYLPQ